MLNKRRIPISLVLGLLLVLAGSGASGGEESRAHRVLFIGNSYTYYNSLPQLFKAMAEAGFPTESFETKFVGGGGATLKKHWEVGLAQTAIDTGAWDVVVLQGQSMLGLSALSGDKSPEQFYKYARLFEREISRSGADTVFFLTWSRENAQQQQPYLTSAYRQITDELDAEVAPVGLVWDRARVNTELDLFQPDGSHPSVVGSYLAALTLAVTILDVNPEEIPGRLTGYEILRGGMLATQKSPLCDLPEDELDWVRESVLGILAEAE